jgi:protein-L-isoaspartate(D-aspartate) O-methyltransferase
MLAALDVKPWERALEVGAGSGYAAAVLSRLAAQVFAIERHGSLARAAEQALERHGYDNVEVLHADGTIGWADRAPFDVILVSAGGREVPPALLDQLAPGGRMVMPVGEPDLQELRLFRREPHGTLTQQELGPVRFVPLIGTRGGVR